MKNSNKKIWVIAFGILALVIFYVSKKKANLEMSEAADAARSSSQTQIVDKLPSKSQSQKSDHAARADRMRYFAKKQAGLTAMPVADRANGKIFLDFKIKSSANKCRLGDLDLIKYDQRYRRSDKGLSFTIENLLKKEVVSRQVVSAEAIVDGYQIRLSMPDSKKGVPFGFYICTGSKTDCSEINSPSVTELMENLFIAKKTNSYPNKPVVFYYQFLLAGEGAVEVISGENDPSGKKLAALKKIITDSEISKRNADKLMKSMRQSKADTGSIDFRSENKMVVVNLPHSVGCDIGLD